MFTKFSGLYLNNFNKIKNIISNKRFSSAMLYFVNAPTISVPSIHPSVSSVAGRKKKLNAPTAPPVAVRLPPINGYGWGGGSHKWEGGGENPKFGITNSTSIVIYGSNLGSTVNKGRYSISLKSLIFLTSDTYSIIVGQLLSDGWLEKYSLNSNTRFRFKQAITRSDYVIHSFIALSHYCSNLPNITTSKRKGNIFYGLGFGTRSLPCFNEIYNLFYKDKVKRIPDNIYDLLTPIAIAH